MGWQVRLRDYIGLRSAAHNMELRQQLVLPVLLLQVLHSTEEQRVRQSVQVLRQRSIAMHVW